MVDVLALVLAIVVCVIGACGWIFIPPVPVTPFELGKRIGAAALVGFFSHTVLGYSAIDASGNWWPTGILFLAWNGFCSLVVLGRFLGGAFDTTQKFPDLTKKGVTWITNAVLEAAKKPGE